MLEYVPAEEHILISSYRQLCEGLPRVYAMSTEDVPAFFDKCRAREVGPCVLVTHGCDFSIFRQAENHPNEDLVKLSAFADWESMRVDRGYYRQLVVGPACKADACHPSHEFVAKTDRFSWFTFPDVPANVRRWYTTNLGIKHPRMSLIPFGLNDDGPGSSMLPQFQGREKRGTLYVNFQVNTLERVRLRQFFQRQPWVTFREANLPVEQYLAEVAEHKYVLCPFGNGLDCYRTYEAVYLGAVPIMPESVFARYFVDGGLPVICASNLFGLNEELLENAYPSIAGDDYDYSPLRLSTWRHELKDASAGLDKLS